MIYLSDKEERALLKAFIKHFKVTTKWDAILIAHSKDTKEGCLHIDVNQFTENGVKYYFTTGCSSGFNYEDRLVEVCLLSNDTELDLTKHLHFVTNYNDRQLQMLLIQNGEYVFFDNADDSIRVASKDNVVGYFICDAFTVTANGDKTTFLELIPATKEELTFVESHSEVNYKELILAMRPHLGERRSVKNIVGLTQDQMKEILATIK